MKINAFQQGVLTCLADGKEHEFIKICKSIDVINFDYTGCMSTDALVDEGFCTCVCRAVPKCDSAMNGNLNIYKITFKGLWFIFLYNRGKYAI